MCDNVMVMYAGQTMEYGTTEEIFYQPSHPYTAGLLESVPRLDTDSPILATIPGNPPNLMQLPPGCPFQDRCGQAEAQCFVQMPELVSFSHTRQRACHAAIASVGAL
jgi:oligopeptide transport system ATP-binding protein